MPRVKSINLNNYTFGDSLFLKPAEIMAILSIARSCIDYYIRIGKLSCFRLRGSVVIKNPHKELYDFIDTLPVVLDKKDVQNFFQNKIRIKSLDMEKMGGYYLLDENRWYITREDFIDFLFS